MNQPPPAPTSATFDPSATPRYVHHLVRLRPLIAIRRVEQARSSRIEELRFRVLRLRRRGGRGRRGRRGGKAGKAGSGKARRHHDDDSRATRHGLSLPARPVQLSSRSCLGLPNDPTTRHRIGRQDRVQLVAVEQPAREHELPDRFAALHRFLGDLRRRRVADVRAEGRGRRRAAFEQLAGARFVGRDAVDAARAEHLHRLAQNRRRVNRVPGDHRHHHVQLELTGLARDRDRRVAAHHLKADLIHHLGVPTG